MWLRSSPSSDIGCNRVGSRARGRPRMAVLFKRMPDSNRMLAAMRAWFDLHATGSPLFDAQADFQRARRACVVARIASLLRPRRLGVKHPMVLRGTEPLPAGRRRMEVVDLDEIVGTVEQTTDFDDRFRPTSDAVRERWERIALAHRRGSALAPVELLRRGDGYYVLDGRHRVSVARALRLRDIDAWVTGPLLTGAATSDRRDLNGPPAKLDNLVGGRVDVKV